MMVVLRSTRLELERTNELHRSYWAVVLRIVRHTVKSMVRLCGVAGCVACSCASLTYAQYLRWPYHSDYLIVFLNKDGSPLAGSH